MSEQPGHDRHWRQTLILLVATLAVVFGAVAACIVFAERLDRIVFLHFPLGFYLLAQGVLVLIVAAAFWSANAQERIDAALAETEED